MMFFWRSKTVTQDHIRELTKLCVQLREDIDDLASKHERLRGRFYALATKPSPTDNDSGSSEASGSSPDTRAQAKSNSRPTKAELLSRYWTPGRPAVHSGS